MNPAPKPTTHKESAAPVDRRGRHTPYVCATIALAVTYVGTLIVTEQQMLAGILAVIAALTGFMTNRLIQLRGKLTLPIVVVALPTLAALLFTAAVQLHPFVRQQRSISLLRNGSFQIRTRSSDQFGEWKRSRSGNMLPTWLANRIGPDCLSELASISGNLTEFQSMRFENIDRSSLETIELLRFSDSPVVSPRLVDWLNDIESPDIRFVLSNYTDADGKALASLKKKYRLTIDVDAYTGDLSKLTNCVFLNLRGSVLTQRQAGQIPDRSTNLCLDGFRLSPDTISTLQPSPNEQSSLTLTVKNSTLDRATLEALARLSDRIVNFENVTLPTESLTAGGPQSNTTRPRMWVGGSDVSISEAYNCVRLFRCEVLSVHLVATQDEIETLWEFPFLERVRIWNQKEISWQEYLRPGSEVTEIRKDAQAP
ncbi:MAG: hypothetical protein AAGI63_11290 [Planctomycetota bacterium]